MGSVPGPKLMQGTVLKQRTVVVSTVCVRDVCECALMSIPKSSVSSSDFSTTFGDVKVKCRDCVRTVAVVESDGHCDGYSVTYTCVHSIMSTEKLIFTQKLCCAPYSF